MQETIGTASTLDTKDELDLNQQAQQGTSLAQHFSELKAPTSYQDGFLAQQNENSFQEHIEIGATCSILEAANTHLFGYWYLDNTQDGFLFDRSCCDILGLEFTTEFIPSIEVISVISQFDAARFWLNLNQGFMGDTIFEHVKLTKGKYAGYSFLVQGSVLARNANGQLMYAAGYISHEDSPYSEFFSREISGDGMWWWNAETGEICSSASLIQMLGYSYEEYPTTIQEFVDMLVHPDDNDALLVENNVAMTTRYGNYFECCLRLKHKNQHYIWTIGRGLVMQRNKQGVAVKILGSQTNISLMNNNFDNIKMMMFTDTLTGLRNRTYFQQNALRYADPSVLPLAIVFIDVSGLKLTNDILGHSYGDFLLIKTCEIVKQAVIELFSKNEFDLSFDLAKPKKNFNLPTTPLDSPDEVISNPDKELILDIHNEQMAQELRELDKALSMIEDNIEILRLAGDELLVLIPQCNEQQCAKFVERIEEIRKHNNLFHKEHDTIHERPVPIFFGLGHAILESQQNKTESLREAIDLADKRMQEDKNSHRERDYLELKEYFELKKGRSVSMRDERRYTLLDQEERDRLRQKQEQDGLGESFEMKRSDMIL